MDSEVQGTALKTSGEGRNAADPYGSTANSLESAPKGGDGAGEIPKTIRAIRTV